MLAEIFRVLGLSLSNGSVEEGCAEKRERKTLVVEDRYYAYG